MGLIPKDPPSAEELARRNVGVKAKAEDKAKASEEKPVAKKRGRPPKKKD